MPIKSDLLNRIMVLFNRNAMPKYTWTMDGVVSGLEHKNFSYLCNILFLILLNNTPFHWLFLLLLILIIFLSVFFPENLSTAHYRNVNKKHLFLPLFIYLQYEICSNKTLIDFLSIYIFLSKICCLPISLIFRIFILIISMSKRDL